MKLDGIFGVATGVVLLAVGLSAPAFAGVVTLYPTADAYVDAHHPDANYGSDSKLRTADEWVYDGEWNVVRSFLDKRSFLTFDVTGAIPSGSTLESATLWLSPWGTGGTPTVGIYKVTEPWTETGVTWNNQPAFDPIALSTWTIVDLPLWVSWDVTAACPSTGNLNLAMWLDVINNASFSASSREDFYLAGSEWDYDYRPHLEIVTSAVPEPGSIGLLSVAAAVLLARRRRRRA